MRQARAQDGLEQRRENCHCAVSLPIAPVRSLHISDADDAVNFLGRARAKINLVVIRAPDTIPRFVRSFFGLAGFLLVFRG